MARSTKSEQVPKRMQERFEAIVAITDAVCREHLNEEFAQLARQATASQDFPACRETGLLGRVPNSRARCKYLLNGKSISSRQRP